MTKLNRYELNLQLFSGEGNAVNEGETGEKKADAEQISTGNSTEEFSELIKGKYKDEFTKRTQAIIDKRFKTTKELEAYKSKVSPLVDRLLEQNGLSSGEEEKLEEILLNTPYLNQQAPQDQANDESFENDSYKHSEADLPHAEILKGKIGEWLRQSDLLKTKIPEFDLRKELRDNKLFSQLLLSGVDLNTAYETVHKDDIIRDAMHYTADTVRRQVVQNIEAKGRRPIENGISAESAVVTSVDVNSLTSHDILKILKQVESGASIKF